MIDIAAIKARADKTSGQSWQAWNMVHCDTGKPMTPDELGEYVKNTVLKSIEDGGSADQFLFVSFDGEGNPDICHVGNGPNRAANAAFIAHARTDIPALIAALEASEAARVKAEQALRTVQNAAKTLEHLRDGELQHLRENRTYDHKLRSEHDSLIERDALMTDRITDLEQEWDALKAENHRLRAGLTILSTSFYKGDQHQAYAKHILEAKS